eukprot:4699746-Pyramimonas_sp.AAC.1
MRRGLGISALEEHGGQELRRWSSARVWAHWGILPGAQELRARRLRWHQSWYKYPEAHKQARAS